MPTSFSSGILLLVALIQLAPGAPAGTRYQYDRTGRLVRVDYADGTGIRYTYDAAGNIIRREAGLLPPLPLISGLSATSGAPGTLLTIRGSNLAGATQISFNGVPATVFTATAGEIVAIVPRAAVSGPITVSTSSGQVLSETRFTVIPPVTEKTLAVQVGGSGSAVTIGPFDDLRAGYATAAVSGGPAPYATAVFSFAQNGTVVSEVGVPASPPTRSARIFVEHRSGIPAAGKTVDSYTGLAAVNRGAGPATVNLRLRDTAGAVLAQGAIQLAQNAHLAKFLDQLAPGFVLPAGFGSSGIGSLEVTSSQPLSILALRLTLNQRGDLLLTSTPVADLEAAASSQPSYFPQVSDGGGYQTTFVFMNTSTSRQTGVIETFSQAGAPLALRPAGGSAAASRFPYDIPPGGVFRLATDGSPAGVNVGWARLTPDAGSSTPVGAGIFSLTAGGVRVTESGVPAASPTTRARIYIDTSSGHDTGLALANFGSSALQAQLQAYTVDGTTPAGGGTGSLQLSGMGHTARFAGQLIPGGLPPGFTGVLDIQGNGAFVALTLRSLVNARGDFLLTTFPIADSTRAAPAPVVFPQVADGGGYQTQFIFIGTGPGAASITVRFFGEDGVPAAIGRP